MSLDAQLRALARFDPRGTGVLSLYLHTDPLLVTHEDVDAQLQCVAGRLMDGLDPRTRAAVRQELRVVQDYLGSMIAPPVGLALFTCTPWRFFRVVRLHVEVTPVALWAPWAYVAPLVAARLAAQLRVHELAPPAHAARLDSHVTGAGGTP